MADLLAGIAALPFHQDVLEEGQATGLLPGQSDLLLKKSLVETRIEGTYQLLAHVLVEVVFL